ncbi:hypothetical protein WJX84_000732 [Apatococcus fuscideae]|uniref:VHS domain-containing protein n=1 Tax=Apatococcus fuscideae TaxID=2026836 RepID=A0AAW1TBK8_9CHLO
MPIFGTKPPKGPQPSKPGDFQNNWDATARLIQNVQAYNNISDDTRAALKRRLRSQDFPTVLATFTVLDSIAINCSRAVRRQLADKKWSKAIYEGCSNLPAAQPALHQLFANWAVLFSGEELGMVCEQACQKFNFNGHRPVAATPFAYEMRELIEQDTPMIGFQRGTDFGDLFGLGQTFDAPDAGADGVHMPVRSNSSSSSKHPEMSQPPPGHEPSLISPSALAAMNRMPEVEYDLKMLGDIHTRCQRLQSSGTSEDTEAGTSLAGDMALGNDVAERCTGWSADVKGLIQQDLGPASLAQLLDLNDRLNIRIRAWHQLVSQLGHCQTAVPADSSPFQQRSAAAASATSTGPSSDGWGRSGSGRSLGSVEAARSISGGSQPGRWSPAPGSLGIVAPKDLQTQGPPTPAQQDSVTSRGMEEDVWDAFGSQRHQQGMGQSVPLIDLTEAAQSPALAQDWGPSVNTPAAMGAHASSGSLASLDPLSTPAQAAPSMAVTSRPLSPSSGSTSHDGWMRTQPALESDIDRLAPALPEDQAQDLASGNAALELSDRLEQQSAGGATQDGLGPLHEGLRAVSAAVPSAQQPHQQPQQSNDPAPGWRAASPQPQQDQQTSAAEDIALHQLRSRLPQALRGPHGDASTGMIPPQRSPTDKDAIDVAALAAGTLALQRQVKGMTAAHAAELKALQEQHATELADVKSRAVTRIKELTAEVAAAKQSSKQVEQLGKATVLAATDQLRESRLEAGQIAAALQAAQSEVRYLQQQMAQPQSRPPKSRRNSNPYTACSAILATAPDLTSVAEAAELPAGPGPYQRPSSAFTMRVTNPAAAVAVKPGLESKQKQQQHVWEQQPKDFPNAPAEATMRAYYHQPALRVRFSPSQFAEMARRLQRTRSQKLAV